MGKLHAAESYNDRIAGLDPAERTAAHVVLAQARAYLVRGEFDEACRVAQTVGSRVAGGGDASSRWALTEAEFIRAAAEVGMGGDNAEQAIRSAARMAVVYRAPWLRQDYAWALRQRKEGIA